MAEHDEIIHVGPSDPGDSGSKKSWRERLADLERERDELRLKLHLAKADAKDEWARLEGKMDELRARARVAKGEASDAAEDIGDAARVLWDEIKEGFGRVRRSMS